jgi:hypothetical protein
MVSDRGKPSFSHVSIDCHRDDIAESEYAGAEDESSSAPAASLFKERQQQPNDSRYTKHQDS